MGVGYDDDREEAFAFENMAYSPFPDGLHVNSQKPRSRVWSPIAFLLPLILVIALSFPFLVRPATHDEVVFVDGVNTFYRTGRPFFLSSDLAHENPFEQSPTRYVYLQAAGGWLPPTLPDRNVVPNFPLYLQLLIGWTKVLGKNLEVLRFFGVTCTLLTLALMWPIGRRIYTEDAKSNKTFLAGGLYVTLPLTPLSAVLLDQDTSILMFTLMAFLLIYLSGSREGTLQSPWWFLAVAVGFGLTLLAKLTTPLVLIPTVVLYSWGASRRMSSALVNLSALLAGVVLFTVAWWWFSSAYGFSFWDPFLHNYQKFQSGLLESMEHSSDGQDFFITLWNHRFSLLFFSPWFLGLMIWSTFRSAKRWVSERRLRPVDFILIYGLLGLAGYYLVRPQVYLFPKYIAPFAAPLALVVAGDVFDFGQAKGWWRKSAVFWLALGGVGTLYAALTLTVFGEPLLVTRGFIWLYVIPFLAVVTLIAIAQGKIKFNAHILILGLAIGTVPFHLGTTLVRMVSHRSVLYCFGEQGLAEAMKYFRAHDSDRENVMASRSFSRLAVQRYVPPELLAQPAWKMGALRFLADPKTRWVIFGACDRQPMYVPEARKVLHDRYRRVDLPGDYQVYRRIRKESAPARKNERF